MHIISQETAQITCPLCASARVFVLRTFSLPELRQDWLNVLKFDPFAEFSPVNEKLVLHQCGQCYLEFFFPAYEGTASFYERMSQAEWYYEENQWEFTEALRRLNSNPKISSLLEIGCGKGYFLEKVVQAYDAFGTEINSEAIETCRAKGLKVTDQTLPDLGRTFDAIVAFEVLEHIARPEEFIEQAYRALTPGGTLIFAVPNPEGYFKEFDHILLDMPPHHATHWRRETFAYLASRYSLQVIDVVTEPLSLHPLSVLSEYACFSPCRDSQFPFAPRHEFPARQNRFGS